MNSSVWTPQIVSAYAELHYRPLPFLVSPLYRRRPEIIFDTVPRIHRDSGSFPLLMIVKDAHLFPCAISDIRIEFSGPPGSSRKLNFAADLQEPLQTEMFRIPLPDQGRFLRFRVAFTLTWQHRRKRFINDTYPGRYRPLTLYISEESYPDYPGAYWSDLHFHSDFTQDSVEFGAPLQVLPDMMEAMELDALAVTDHSYDLCVDGEQAATIERFNRFRTKIQHLNRNSGRMLIPGEEVSVRGSRDQTLHLLVLNHTQCIPGSGDSGRQGPRRSCELSLPEVLSQLDSTALAIAAHPQYRPPRAERLLLKRGHWYPADLAQVPLWQLGSGNPDTGFTQGLQYWQEQLSAGHRHVILAGSDGHGGFNQSRQMGVPFLTIRRDRLNIPGGFRTLTALPVGEKLTLNSFLSALRSGRSQVSSGPILMVRHQEQLSPTQIPAGTTLTIEPRTTREFGDFNLIRVYGERNGREHVLMQWENEDATHPELTFSTAQNPGSRYLRFEGATRLGRRVVTNSIFFTGD